MHHPRHCGHYTAKLLQAPGERGEENVPVKLLQQLGKQPGKSAGQGGRTAVCFLLAPPAPLSAAVVAARRGIKGTAGAVDETRLECEGRKRKAESDAAACISFTS